MPRRFPFHLLATLPPAGDHVPDAELLRRFARDRDPAALELVVRRHADAVWAACRRVSRSEADAEDAFQAAFLVLARKAASVRGACAGGWLHRVAVNAALKLRAAARREGEAPAEPGSDRRLGGSLALPETDDPPQVVESDELAAVVQEEVARLPDRYRLPVVLCDLEGQSHAEAARALRWPVGSVSGRLSRARGLLRDRLARRGYGAAPVVILPAGGLPPRLVSSTTAAVSGAVPVSPSVSLVAEGVLSAMRTAKLQLTAAVVASAGLLGLAGVGTYTVLAQDTSAPKTGTVPKAEPRPDFVDRNIRWDEPYRKLLKEQWDEGMQEWDKTKTRIQLGQFSSTDFKVAYECLTDMRRVAAEFWADDPKSLVAALELVFGHTKEMERFTQVRVAAGTDPPQQRHTAIRHRAAAEAALWKAKNPKPVK